MTNEEAKELYQRAMARAEASDFTGALGLFDELDAARPNSRHVTGGGRAGMPTNTRG